jgi:hypothetical protein
MSLRVYGLPIAVAPMTPAFTPSYAPPGAAAPGSGVLSVPRIAQEQTNWCWAAFSEMIFKYYGISSVRQCDMASWQFGAACCAAPSSSICNAPNWPNAVLTNWGINHLFTSSSVSFSSVQFEIGSGRPVGSYYAWTGGGAHVAVVIGWYDNNDVHVNDPWYSVGRISYVDLVAAYGLGTWAGTYTNLKRI